MNAEALLSAVAVPLIVARDGAVLAANEPAHRLFTIPPEAGRSLAELGLKVTRPGETQWFRLHSEVQRSVEASVDTRPIEWNDGPAQLLTVHIRPEETRAEAISRHARRPLDAPRQRTGQVCVNAAEELASLGLSVLAFENAMPLELHQFKLPPEERLALESALRRPLQGATFPSPHGSIGRALEGDVVLTRGGGEHPLRELLGVDLPPPEVPQRACAVPVGWAGSVFGVLVALAPDLGESDCKALEAYAGRCAAALLAARHLEEFEALYRLTHAAGTLDHAQIEQEAVTIVTEVTRADCVALALREDGQERIACAHGLDVSKARAFLGHQSGSTAIARAAREIGFQRTHVFPLGGREGSLGALVVCRRDDRQISVEEQSLLLVLCAALSSALDNARLFRESRQQVEDLQRLFTLGHAVAGEMALPSVLRLAARTGAALVRADDAFLVVPARKNDAFSLEVSACLHGDADGSVNAHAHLERVRQLATRAFRQRSALLDEHASDGVRLAAAPLLSGERPIGCIVAARTSPHAPDFGPAELQRLGAVADYVVVAIGSAELLEEQQRRVGELVTLNDVASACAELGMDNLLSAVTGRIRRALGAEVAALAFLDHQRKELFLGTVATGDGALTPGRVSLPMGAGLSGRAAQMRQPRRGKVAELGFAELRELAERKGLEHAAAVPLLVKDGVLGVAVVLRAGAPVNDDELRLLAALCAQVAVAVENAQLFAQVNRRAADLELVQAVGEVVASSLDADAILRETGRRLVDAVEADAVRIYIREGDTFHTVATHGLPPEEEPVLAQLPESDPLVARAIRTSSPAALAQEDLPARTREFIQRLGLAHLASAPLVASRGTGGPESRAISGVILAGRRAPRRFAPEELRVLGAVATQVAVALTNAKLFAETRRRAEEMAVVAEAGRALVGGAPLEETLDLVADRLASLVGMRECVISLIAEEKSVLDVTGISREISREARHLRLEIRQPSLVSRAITERRPYSSPDAPNDPRVSPELIARWPIRSLFLLPLLAQDETVGVVALGDPEPGREPSASEIERVLAVSNQVAIAIERARLNAELERSYRELEETQAQLVRRERLAALGELAAQVAHEVRNPLGVIFSTLGSLAKVVPLEGDGRRLYDMLREEADRLNRIVGDLVDFARPAPPTLRPGALDRVMEDAVFGAQTFERSRGRNLSHVTTRMKIAPELPLVPMDERQLRQALMNLLSNAYQALELTGGTVEVSARTLGDGAGPRVRLSVADDGPGIPPDVQERLFEPFFTTKATGSGLGLAVVRRIVEGHRGEVTLESAPGRGTVFHVDLPVVKELGRRAEGAVA